MAAAAASTGPRRVVYVKSVTDNQGSLALALPPDTFVLDMKEAIAAQHPYCPPPAAQKLVFGGRVLADNERLEALTERVRPQPTVLDAAHATRRSQQTG